MSRFLSYLSFFFESFIHSFPISLVSTIIHLFIQVIFTEGCSIIFTLFAKLVSTPDFTYFYYPDLLLHSIHT